MSDTFPFEILPHTSHRSRSLTESPSLLVLLLILLLIWGVYTLRCALNECAAAAAAAATVCRSPSGADK